MSIILKHNVIVESTEGLKFWEMVFNETPTLTEYELVNVLLRIEGLDENASNNTKMLNKIFKAYAKGYIKQTSLYSHVWELALKK